MAEERRIDEFPHARAAVWQPQLPAGRLDRIYLHWSAGDYETVYTSYHYCVALRDGEPIVARTNDLRANMRDVYGDGGNDYAAHTYRRNAYSAGLAIMAMRGARPDDFGDYPLTPELTQALCAVAASIARAYSIPIDADHVLTHAEAAVADGYFGTADDERWDIARLHAQPRALLPADAAATGEILRDAIRAV